MKTYEKYVFRAIDILCLILTIVSFMGLRESIQIERANQNMKGYQAFVSDVVLPSTPRIVRTPKATVKKKKIVQKSIDTSNHDVLSTYTGNMSYYASDCKGCTGATASGYRIGSGNIYYHDAQYGSLRIVAGDSSFAFGTVIRIQMNGTSTLAIVLDRRYWIW